MDLLSDAISDQRAIIRWPVDDELTKRGAVVYVRQASPVTLDEFESWDGGVVDTWYRGA